MKIRRTDAYELAEVLANVLFHGKQGIVPTTLAGSAELLLLKIYGTATPESIRFANREDFQDRPQGKMSMID